MVKALDKKGFEDEVLKEGVCLVDFWAAWCGPCKMLAPVIEELSNEFSGSVKFFKIDIDQYPELAMDYKIMSIPTVILFKDGVATNKLVGLRDKSEYAEMLES